MPDRVLIAAADKGLEVAETGGAGSEKYEMGMNGDNLAEGMIGGSDFLVWAGSGDGVIKKTSLQQALINTSLERYTRSLDLLDPVDQGHDDTASDETTLPATDATLYFYLPEGTAVYIQGGSTSQYNISRGGDASEINFSGPPLPLGEGEIETIYIGRNWVLRQYDIFIPGNYGDSADAELIKNDSKTYFKSFARTGAILDVRATHRTAAATTQPKINVLVNGNRVLTQGSGNGIQLGAAGAWVNNDDGEIALDYYLVDHNSTIEIECTAGSVPADGARDLTVSLLIAETIN